MDSPQIEDKGVIKMRTNIEAERGRLQLTKGEMCKALGITGKTYNSYIKGGAIPSTALEKLKKMTGKSIDYLLGMLPDTTNYTE
mgnify:CR=1 FL=1